MVLKLFYSNELNKLRTPQVKLLNNKGYMDYETYKHIKNMTIQNYKLDENNNIIEDDDQEYPF